MKTPVLIPIVGATAAGKSDVALDLARRFGGEVINFDSVQFYKGVQVGAAKPTSTERAEIKHHLLDVADPQTPFTAADFRRRALEIIETGAKLKVPAFYLVGGSGFYLQALLKGMFEVPPIEAQIKHELVAEIAVRGLPSFYEELVARDPEYAARIKPQDTYRVQRAFEILRGTGLTPSELQASFKPQSLNFRVFPVGVRRARARLLERIETRTAQMLTGGLLEETQGLLQKGYRGTGPLKSVGYKETVEYIDGVISKDQWASHINIATRQLAKRQVTWFQRDPEINWFDPDLGLHPPREFISEVLRSLS